MRLPVSLLERTAPPLVLDGVKRLPPLLAVLLAGCLGPALPGPPSPEPRFTPERWFQGRTVGQGEFRRITGGGPRRFSMVIEGRWDGRTLLMDETFTTAEGRWNRLWTIRPLGGGRYEGRLTTGRGLADIRAEGDTVRMRYRAEAPLSDGFVAGFDQALRLRPDGTVLNVADVSKWGLPVGRTTVVFRKTED